MSNVQLAAATPPVKAHEAPAVPEAPGPSERLDAMRHRWRNWPSEQVARIASRNVRYELAGWSSEVDLAGQTARVAV